MGRQRFGPNRPRGRWLRGGGTGGEISGRQSWRGVEGGKPEDPEWG